METAPLKSFATWARTALIREVAARIAIVLAPASPERVEQPNAVATLEKAVSAAGGWDAGRAAVADKVAYTWFNRIIALRFMDANGYTGIGVVSPERGREGGQPEVLAEAKRGNIDSTVISSKRTVETVTSLLNGTRRSDDPQGEAYALLLAEYCRYWNRSMPFMFEREGDYTELLIPANLLADDSVMARAVTVLTTEVCRDVEVIGWLYQFYISERKDEVFAGFKKNRKAGAAEIPAATQLFTPHWIVRFLVENSLGRLWLLNRPSSRLADQMEYYIVPVGDKTDFLKIASPEELKIIDPACGSGHMLSYAFDLLYAIYAEEGYAPSDIPGLILANNLHGTEIDPRAGALAAFALTMKARARQRAFFNKQVEPNICVLEPILFTPGEVDTVVSAVGDRVDEAAFWNQFQHADTFGSLIRPREELIEPLKRHLATHQPNEGDIIGNELHERASRVLHQAEYLTNRYHVVVANPPYMAGANMGELLAKFAKRNYAASKADLMTMFMERVTKLTLKSGYWGMINLPSWMFISSFTNIRRLLLRGCSVVCLLQLGRGVFGSDFGSVAFILRNNRSSNVDHGIYRRLFDRHVEVRTNEEIEKLFLDKSFNSYVLAQSSFELVPNAPFIYWLSPELLNLFASVRSVGKVYDLMAGISTGNNSLYFRYWFEVSAASITDGEGPVNWVLHHKGGEYRRWYGNINHVLQYSVKAQREMAQLPGFRHDGRSGYFRPHIGWTSLSAGATSFRWFPAGLTFGSGSKALLSEHDDLPEVLGVLNSATATELLEALSPTLNFEVGHISNLPVPRATDMAALRPIVDELISIAREDWNSRERSHDFLTSPLVEAPGDGSLPDRYVTLRREMEAVTARMAELERIVNDGVAHAFGLASNANNRVNLRPVTIDANPAYRYGDRNVKDIEQVVREDVVLDFISYAVGCMFGRYGLDEPGLILANQGETIQDYLAKVPNPSFMPDKDNVIPIVDGDWFEDDIVARFRLFLQVAFGGKHFEENLRFVTEALGVKDLRDYFVKSFYKNHVQRYKKRPIYWLFSSPKGSFNALIYMHRYIPSTVSTVLNEYLREFKAKLEASRQHYERLGAGAETARQQAAAQKELDRLRNVLLELDEYEHDVLYPLATQQVQIDLDDGVKANYPKFGAALKKIIGLEASDE